MASSSAPISPLWTASIPLPGGLAGLCLTAAGWVWDDEFAPTGAPTNALDVLLR
jgi:hypothetical protein